MMVAMKRTAHNNRMKSILVTLGILLCVIVGGCHHKSYELEPRISYAPPPRLISKLPETFPELTCEERAQEWGKELFLGRSFAREMDLYRALTCFKSALFLIPKDQCARRLEIEYDIFFAYYLANKYTEAIEVFECGDLIYAPDDFPGLRNLLITLYDAYIKTDQPEKAYRLLCLISKTEPETTRKLALEKEVLEANFCNIVAIAEEFPDRESIDCFLAEYSCEAKSVSKAQTLNAILPGAGYYYVGQKKAAWTSFLINALFIGAAYQLFDRGYIPAGIIVTSLEAGWYFGGINGAGLAAKEYNQRLYSKLAKEMMLEKGLFPILMIQTSF